MSKKDKTKEKKEKYNPIDPPELKHPPKIDVNMDGDGGNNLKDLIEKNIRWSEVIFEQNRKIKRRLGWMVFAGYFKLALILTPIILAIIYLPPIFEEFWQQYGQLLGGGSDSAQGLPISEIIGQMTNEQIQDILMKLRN